MSCGRVSVLREVRPGTARVLVTELSGSGHINPTPTPKLREDYKTAVGCYLSQEKLVNTQSPQDTGSVHPTTYSIVLDRYTRLVSGSWGGSEWRLEGLHCTRQHGDMCNLYCVQPPFVMCVSHIPIHTSVIPLSRGL